MNSINSVFSGPQVPRLSVFLLAITSLKQLLAKTARKKSFQSISYMYNFSRFDVSLD